MALLHNAALLLAVAVVGDALMAPGRRSAGLLSRVLAGVAVGILGLGLAYAGGRLDADGALDARSVLLAVSGLFLGAVPTVVAMAMLLVFVLFLGGTGVGAATGVILVSGGLGMGWRWGRRRVPQACTWRELLVFGGVVHLAVLACLATLPAPFDRRRWMEVGLPVLVLLPLATAGLGRLMATRGSRAERAVPPEPPRQVGVTPPLAPPPPPGNLDPRAPTGHEVLAGGMAHDLNNILAPILITAPILRGMATDPEDVLMLETIETCARRGTDLIRQWAEIARGASDARTVFPMRHLVRYLERRTRDASFPGPRMSVSMDKDLWPVVGRVTGVFELLMAFGEAAGRSLSSDHTLVLDARNVAVDPAQPSSADELTSGPRVRLRLTGTRSELDPALSAAARREGAWMRPVSGGDGAAVWELHLPARPVAEDGTSGGTGPKGDAGEGRR